jgi:hypothetical protein
MSTLRWREWLRRRRSRGIDTRAGSLSNGRAAEGTTRNYDPLMAEEPGLPTVGDSLPSEFEYPRAEAAGYYLWPLAWIGSPPTGVKAGADPGENPTTFDYAEMRHAVVEAELGHGLRARAFRDGLFVFDFSQWAPYLPEHLQLGNFERRSGAESRTVSRRRRRRSAFPDHHPRRRPGSARRRRPS